LHPHKNRAERIVLVVSSLGGGGAERVVVDLCRFLRDSGREVVLLTLSGNDPDAYALPPGVRRERMEIRRDANSLLDTVRFSLGHLVAMRSRIVSLRPDAVVSFVDQTNARTLACLLGSGVPVIVSERIHPAHHPLPDAWKAARRLTYPLADAVVVQTGDIAEWFRRRTRVKRLLVISNAARYDGALGAGDEIARSGAGGGLVLAIGRLAKQKGFDLLLEAFHRAGLAERQWRLAIVGEGPERDALMQQAASLGIAGALTLPGHVNDIGRWLALSDIFALSSRYEGFPNALLEAMQMGRACAAFDCPSGPRDLLAADAAGLLVPPGDIDALSAALQRLAGDSALRDRLGRRAAIVAEQLAPARIYGKWLGLIDAVAAGNAEAVLSAPAAPDSLAG
jgi:glycosyltransferase involved in cell wall biosynthesis